MTVRVKRDTAADWTAANIVLADGQLGSETDTGRVKVGNGATAWTSLAYRFESGGGIGNSFETVSKNLSASNATLAYSGGDLSTITYANGIIKTLGYGPDGLATVTLSGATPGGINLTKTLQYTLGELTGFTYS